MTDIKLDEYYSAGYFLIRKSRRPAWLDQPTGLIADELISLEDQFCPKFNVGWGWGSENREYALQFGIDESKWDDFQAWCANYETNEIEVWCMFRSAYAARRLMKEFIPESKWNELALIGVGLHKSCEPDWSEPPTDTEGVVSQILKKLPMETGGHILGFDVASYAHNNFDHTWFSHIHHRGVAEELNIRPGKFGLLETREEAVLARDYTDAHDGYVYEYWLLVDYPI